MKKVSFLILLLVSFVGFTACTYTYNPIGKCVVKTKSSFGYNMSVVTMGGDEVTVRAIPQNIFLNSKVGDTLLLMTNEVGAYCLHRKGERIR